MEVKLTFEIPKTRTKGSQVIRSSTSFYNMVDLIQTKTGLSAVEVTRRIADYLGDRLEFIEREE